MGGKEGIEKYDSICNIGSGACGSVYLVRNKENAKLYALKKIQLDENRKTRTREAVEREARILSELKHPHIVAYHESFLTKGEEYMFLCIIQDYCDGGTLDDKIKTAAATKQYMDEKQIIQWFLQIALAVRFMHSKKVLHRDLKTANVFLNKSGSLCKLGDFGIAKSMDTTIDVASTCVGTPCYLAPEMCQDIPYSNKADVWALGCMLYEMLALRPAFDAHNLVSLFYKIVQGQHEPLPPCYSDNIQHVISTILTKDPQVRPSARGVLCLPFLREELRKFVEEKQFILEKIRVPTRQGSRPYSTSNILRSSSENFEVRSGSASESAAAALGSGGGGDMKRATSCRPVMLNRSNSREKSLIMVTSASATAAANRKATASKKGRVSTIPEESDEVERTLKIEQTIRLNQVKEEQRSKSMTPTRSRSSTPAKVKANKDLSRTLSHSGDRAPSRTDKASKSKAPAKKETTGTKQKEKKPKDQAKKPVVNQKVEEKKKVTKKNSKEKLEPIKASPYSQTQKLYHSLDASSGAESGGDTGGGDAQGTKADGQWAMEETNMVYSETESDDSEEDEGGIFNNNNKENVTSKNILSSGSLPLLEGLKRELPLGPDLNKRHRIQEPTRTPRIQNPNPLVIQISIENHSGEVMGEEPRFQPIQRRGRNMVNPLGGMTIKPETPQSIQRLPSLATENSLLSHKGRKRSSAGGRHRRRLSLESGVTERTQAARPGTRDSLLSVPYEPSSLQDYYSDDFDDCSSASDIEEEIPEEISEHAKTARTRSFTSHDDSFECEIPEIEEELEAPDDFDSVDYVYEDMDDIEEELDEVVTVAREACEELDSMMEASDPVIMENRPSTSRVIKKHCIDVLGREKYEKIRKYCENNENVDMKKVEKMVGKEHAKTASLVIEIAKAEKS